MPVRKVVTTADEVVARARASGESEDLELKRAWWRLDGKSAQELCKDVAGMANAHGPPNQPRNIVIGVDEEGHTHDAPLPGDEARIQDVLATRIDPRPSVRFDRCKVNEHTVYVLVVDPPFDRPYVVRADNNRTVYLRTGTRVCTASRQDLDRMYTSNLSRQKLALELDALQLAQAPHLRVQVVPQSRDRESFKGRICARNVGSQALDVTSIILVMRGPNGARTLERSWRPTAIGAGEVDTFMLELMWSEVRDLLPDGADAASDAWKQVWGTLSVTCRALSGTTGEAQVDFDVI